MERAPEVIDCWFDSGAMPFAQWHWPFENPAGISSRFYGASKKLKPPELFPADYISEAIDQTRGWFYTLLAISTLLGFGIPYKNVISLGHVLDKKGEKMSKSKGNVVEPWSIIEKYGADATRWYFFTVNQPGDAKLFKEKDIEECLKRFLITFWNCYTFFETYGINPKPKNPKPKNILDKWIISKLNELILDVSNYLDKYDVTFAARAIENFTIEDFSQWYIRRSRKRFQKPETKKELKEASETLNYVLLTLGKLIAPFAPFICEEIYRNLTKKGSVHLEGWPKVNKIFINKKLNEKMRKVRKIVALGLKERSRLGIKVRQPLNSLKIPAKIMEELEIDLLNLIEEEVNVKRVVGEVVIGEKAKGREEIKIVKLDTKITPALREEGIIREVIRQIQEMRKKVGLKPRHKILIRYSGGTPLNKILIKKKSLILGETKAKDFYLGEQPKLVFDIEREIKVDGQKLWLAIKKL